MDTFGARLKKAIREDRRSKAQIARDADMSEMTLMRWEKREEAPSLQRTDTKKNLDVIVATLGIRREWLLTGMGEMQAETSSKGSGGTQPEVDNDGGGGYSDVTTLPHITGESHLELVEYGVMAGSENGQVTLRRDPVAAYVAPVLTVEDLRRGERPEHPYLLKMYGESMREEFLPGEHLAIEPYPPETRRIPLDAIYVFRIEGEVQVKQIEYRPGGKLLVNPINERYSGYEIDLEKLSGHFEVIGRVWGKFKRY